MEESADEAESCLRSAIEVARAQSGDSSRKLPKFRSQNRFYCIRSSMSEKAALSFRAFLISSALKNGYSPYSMKLGHWWSYINLTKAGAFVLQSVGKPSRFSKTVVRPVAAKIATASSVYLSKAVSKMPIY